MRNSEVILKLCNKCIDEGEKVLRTEWKEPSNFANRKPTFYVEIQQFKKWQGNCLLLMNHLGSLSSTWASMIKDEFQNQSVNAKIIIGALKSIKEALDEGLLFDIEDLIYAEAFTDLLEQAEYLFEKNFILASGVICRAILEEKLRKMCDKKEYIFEKDRPTISDYNQMLYKNLEYDKVIMKKIDHLTSIGNKSAHNEDITKDEINELLRGVKDLLFKFN